jgi:TldD protein
MKHLLVFAYTLTLWFCALPSQAEDDYVLKALTDEMDRSTKSLQLDSHPLPFFLSYTVKEFDQATCFSCLGSEAKMQYDCKRVISPNVKIGSYEFNSSFPSTKFLDYHYPIAVDNNYNAVRREAWLATDVAYKHAITNFEWKKAYLSDHNLPDRLPDTTREKPTTFSSEGEKLSLDDSKWCKVVQQLSEIFKAYPTLQKSKVSFMARTVNRWYVNNEGSRIRDSKKLFTVTIWASGQAADGMPVSDHDVAASTDEATLPDFDHLKKMTEELAKRVSEMRTAAKADEEYCGPVFFEGQAAAEFFSQIMAPNLGMAEEPLTSHEDWRNPLTKMVGRRVLSKSLDVVDDPLLTAFGGTPLVGGHKFDDDGVLGERVKLVENGILKGFCQSRFPTRQAKKSNGHSQAGLGVHSILQLSCTKPVSQEELKSRMVDLAKDAGLDYILVIDKLCVCNSYEFDENLFAGTSNNQSLNFDMPAYSSRPTDPIVAYRLYLNDGHKEPLRGLEFKDVSLRAFRDIGAVLDNSAAYLVEPGDHVTKHLITPSYLVRELELTPMKPEHSAPPKLTSPLASDTKP